MSGLEQVLLRVAGAAVGALAKSLVTRPPGAGLAVRPARPAPRWRRPAELGPEEVTRLTGELAGRLAGPYARLPEADRVAVADAVRDAFAGLGTLDLDALLAADLDPEVLAAALPEPPGAALGETGSAAYRELALLCCRHLVEYATTLPGFDARATVELVRRSGALTESVAGVLRQLPEAAGAAAYAFEERYATYLAEAHGRLQLYGLTFSQGRQEWPLDLAYISLAVSGDRLPPEGPAFPHTGRTPELPEGTVPSRAPRPAPARAEEALRDVGRLLLRGPAGSGKSTLVQWLALNAARRSFGPGLHDWNTCVPFVLRLRSFTSAEVLPPPEEFLRASGVPLTAPAGWAEGLMASGRALVLVDGVDEVPQRLRNRTEAWLRSLLAAFPKARYVVTTRPSAVPEDWLAGQGFARWSLLPMGRREVRAFIAHWHTAARSETAEAAERERLDAYEGALAKAVGNRRDLERLATNPLMCALLCALNRDRRMQLPRARKELYEAALDMLLVRRDTEREISWVEGVDPTREEQTVLLQRLAYWLIRNGQLEAAADDVVEMLDEWMDAMPQVRAQGSARQIHRHLLIRSGVLREPVPGAVHFVHRTFQDYLGARAAVEARDFGVLVRNAQDDGWEDVVRMAVGHARPDERARLLTQLLRRADRSKRHHHRLVLLAATCLEHAPELDPEVREAVRARTAELLPPRSFAQAEELARAGELVLDLLPDPPDLPEAVAAMTVRTAAMVGGERALDVVRRFRKDGRPEVARELAGHWGRFPTRAYAEQVLADAELGAAELLVHTAAEVRALAGLPGVARVLLSGDHGVPEALRALPSLTALTLQNNGVRDLSPLGGLTGLRDLALYTCPRVADLEPVADLPLRGLALGEVPAELSLAPVAGLSSLSLLSLNYRVPVDRISELPAPEGLTTLDLHSPAAHVAVDTLERWPSLRWLTVSGPRQFEQLVRLPVKPALTTLSVEDHPALDLSALAGLPGLSGLYLFNCQLAGGVDAVGALPGLGLLSLWAHRGVVDLLPLASRDRLMIVLGPGCTVKGAEHIPRERLRYGA